MFLETWLVQLKYWTVNLFPVLWQPAVDGLISVAVILGVFATLFAVATLLERKGLGRIQNRPGPNRVGPWGLFQPAADGIKMLTKEDIIPREADKLVHFLAPLVLLAPVTLAFAVIPFGQNLVPIDLDAGLLFFFAVGSAAEVAAFMAGWSSHNKYSLLGAMRAIAQMISFELPLVISTVAIIMMSGSLSLVEIVRAQDGHLFGLIPRWHLFTPWGLAGFLIFFMGEYFGMFAVSGLAATLFLGGWHAPLPFLDRTLVPSFVWFFGKLLLLLFVFIWLRGTLPRLRVDQLMNFSWKFLLPLALINLLVVALWRFTAPWPLAGRWALCLAALAVPVVALGVGLMRHRQWKPRRYRYAN